MNIKRLAKALLFPHVSLLLILLPISISLLVYSLAFNYPASLFSILSYVLSFYVLLIVCFRIPEITKLFKTLKKNKHVKAWQRDERLRVNVSIHVSMIINVAYAIFHCGLGFIHRSFWFFSIAIYYASLALMRSYLASHVRKRNTYDNVEAELKKYRNCGWSILFLNIALSIIVFFMIYWNRTFIHHEITTIAMAAYTFTSFTLGIINVIRYRKYNSPVYSASKSISLTASTVSILTLESTMLTTFGQGTINDSSRKLMLALTGGAISVFIIIMAIYMIIQSNKKLKQGIKNGKQRNV